MYKKSVFLLICLIFIATPAVAQVTFANVTNVTGSGGIAPYSTSLTWVDFDDDGDLDLYVTNWGTATGANTNNALFLNNGNGTFTDVASAMKVTSSTNNSLRAVWGDYDNDGDTDLYVTNFYNQDELYKNMLKETGSVVFSNVTNGSGLNVVAQGNETSAIWGDYDNDGWLDLYITKYYAMNELYKNNKNGTFTAVTSTAGVGDIRDSERATWIDYNNDGYLDLYIINREQDNKLYQNNGDGTFTEVAGKVGVNDTGVGRNAVWGDFNNDGNYDLFVANIGNNSLYRNSYTFSFTNVTSTFGAGATSTGWESWDASWADIDGDGDLDLAVVGGAEAGGLCNALFLNNLTSFSDITDASNISRGPWSDNSYSTSAGFADYDNDGDPDLYITNQAGAHSNYLYQNLQSGGKFIKVRITGKGDGGCNVSGIGSVIKLYEGTNTTPVAVRIVQSGAEPFEQIFGIDNTKTYTLGVTFHASGKVVSWPVKSSDLIITINEND